MLRRVDASPAAELGVVVAEGEDGGGCVERVLQTIRWTRKGLRYVFLTNLHVAQDRIIQFDQGQRDQIQPFTLRMRPAQISRAGKKRRETPSDGELRGTGLTVNPVQLHIEFLDRRPPHAGKHGPCASGDRRRIVAFEMTCNERK